MTKDQFPDFFVKTLATLPAHAYDSISRHVKEHGIEFFPEVSNKNIDWLEQQHGTKYSSALTLLMNKEWRILFREFLLDAPHNVLVSIIKHEAAHAYIISQMTLPAQARDGAFTAVLVAFHSSPEIGALKAADGYNEEETLTVFINMMWGSDEAGANQWVSENQAGV